MKKLTKMALTVIKDLWKKGWWINLDEKGIIKARKGNKNWRIIKVSGQKTKVTKPQLKKAIKELKTR